MVFEHSDEPSQGSAQTAMQSSGLADQKCGVQLCKTCSTFTADLFNLDSLLAADGALRASRFIARRREATVMSENLTMETSSKPT